MAAYFPLFMNLEQAPVLILGGGEKAVEKAERLLPYGAKLTVAAQNADERLVRLSEEGKLCLLTLCPEAAEELILRERPRLVILADLAEDALPALFALCRKHGIEVNAVDREEYCTVILPSVIRRNHLTVAVSTGGASPAAAKRIREDIEAGLPSRVDDVLVWMSEVRKTLRERGVPKGGARAAFFRALVDESFAADRPLTEEETEKILAKFVQDT